LSNPVEYDCAKMFDVLKEVKVKIRSKNIFFM